MSCSTKIYLSDNDTDVKTLSEQWDLVRLDRTSCTRAQLEAFSPPTGTIPQGLVATSVGNVEQFVLGRCGAWPGNRDPVDARIVSNAQNRSGNMVDDPSDVGGYPDMGSNHRLFVDADNPDGIAASGYTIREEYLHALAAAVE